jgi:hypothetical protein
MLSKEAFVFGRIAPNRPKLRNRIPFLRAEVVRRQSVKQSRKRPKNVFSSFTM